MAGFLPPFRPRARRSETDIGSLPDQVTFKLSNGGEDMIAQLSGWRRGIDMLGQTVEVDAAPVQFS